MASNIVIKNQAIYINDKIRKIKSNPFYLSLEERGFQDGMKTNLFRILDLQKPCAVLCMMDIALKKKDKILFYDIVTGYSMGESIYEEFFMTQIATLTYLKKLPELRNIRLAPIRMIMVIHLLKTLQLSNTLRRNMMIAHTLQISSTVVGRVAEVIRC
jgi:hypothetical protein